MRWSETIEHRLRGRFTWSLFLAGSAGLAALFMFLTHVVAVRVLSTSEYGVFSSAIALVGIIGVGATSIQAVTVRQVKGALESDEPLFSTRTQHVLLGLVALALGGTALLLLGVSATTAMLLVVWVPAAVMTARANGEIQGRELQMLLHGGTILVTFASLMVSVFLSLVAPEVDVFLLGRLLITIAFATYLLRSVKIPIRNGLHVFSSGMVHSAVVVSSMWFAANMDVLLGRAVLDSEAVGQIAVAAMLVNSVLLMPGLIASVVYPKSVAHSQNRKTLVRLLISSVGLAASLQLVVALLLLFTSGFLIEWLAGPGHDPAKDLVFPLALAYIPLGASIVLSQFLLAIGRLVDGAFFVIVVLTVASLTAIRPETAMEFVQTLHWMSWLLAVALLVQVGVLIARVSDRIRTF